MNLPYFVRQAWPPFIMAMLFAVAILCRPLLPIDETRYMSVAWEMHLHQGWLAPLTVNFEPYHHKPPLLFWLINLFWSVFGISRWAGLIPIICGSCACVYLTGVLGKRLFAKEHDAQRTYLVMVASLPFMIYSTLVMFDMMLTVLVLLSFICLHDFYTQSRLRYAALMGLFLGLGVLTKGPVAYLYVLPVALLCPLWGHTRPRNWYRGITLAVVISFIPVLFWLIPVLQASDHQFAFWLVWNQTAGRVTGNFSASHVRPFWFYLPIVPLFFMPWIFFPKFWQGMRNIKEQFRSHEGLRFLLCWSLPVLIAFSAISGKQPHYLVPLLPAMALFVAYQLKTVSIKFLACFSGTMLLLLVAGQMIAGQTVLKKYELEPLAEMVRLNPDRDLAFVSNYNGELGFLAKRTTPIMDVKESALDKWFDTHPHGWAIIKFHQGEAKIQKYEMIFSMPYRSRNIGLFKR